MSQLRSISLLVAVLVGSWSLTGGLQAADPAPDPAFRPVKKAFLSKIHSKKPADRVAALTKLGEHPTTEAADLVFKSGFTDGSAEVRNAAVAVVVGWREGNDLSGWLIEKLAYTTRREGMDQRTYCVLKALGGVANEGVQQRVVKYLDEFLGTPKANQLLIHTLADNLGEQGDIEALHTLMLFTKAKFFEKNFGYRRCLFQAMIAIKDREAISALIDYLPKLTGIIQYDVIIHLTAVTGQNFRDDAAKWRAWWAQNKAKTIEVDPKKSIPRELYGNSSRYYGLPICAKRVVFVLDVSGSMRGGKLDAAKRELIQAINSLPQEVHFSVIAFNATVRVWQHTLVPATESNKQIAIQMVQSQIAATDTNSFDALEAAYVLDPEAIYFLSDGAPTTGRVVKPNEIISSIVEVNRLRRVSVYSIGIGTNDTTTAIFARFMKGLAGSNWGEYVAVDG